MGCNIFLLFFFILLFSCSEKKGFVFKAPTVDTVAASKNEAVATFASGCFWHTEIVFQSLYGVRDAVSGYAGGNDAAPTYGKVTTGTTGHAESVNVYYDSLKVPFSTLLAAFFASHDPTQVNRQGPDIGPQYRSVAFYRTAFEKDLIEKEIARINASKKYRINVATQVLPLTVFYPAESYHQEYIASHPEEVYVKYYNIPDYLKFRQSFTGPFKDTLITQ